MYLCQFVFTAWPDGNLSDSRVNNESGGRVCLLLFQSCTQRFRAFYVYTVFRPFNASRCPRCAIRARAQSLRVLAKTLVIVALTSLFLAALLNVINSITAEAERVPARYYRRHFHSGAL